MSSLTNYKIPFDAAGNQQAYPQHWYVGEYPNCEVVGPHWRDNVPFNDTLTYDGYYRGRSAAGLIFRTSKGTTTVMFMTDLDACLKHFNAGKVTGTWRFVKRGTNFGVQLQKQSDPAAS